MDAVVIVDVPNEILVNVEVAEDEAEVTTPEAKDDVSELDDVGTELPVVGGAANSMLLVRELDAPGRMVLLVPLLVVVQVLAVLDVAVIALAGGQTAHRTFASLTTALELPVAVT